jgi:hypothetical protein
MFRGVIAGLAVAVLMAAEPAAASVTDPVRSPQWISTECATGSLTAAKRDVTGGVIVIGAAEECGNHVPRSIFAVATFHVRNPDYKPFAELADARFFRKGESRPFGVRTFYGTGTEAVCLMGSATKRIACVSVTVPATGPVTITRLDTDDPVVDRPVELGWRDPGNPGGGTDKCGNCW